MGIAGDSGDKGECDTTLAQTPDVQGVWTLRVPLVPQDSSPSWSLCICHQTVVKHLMPCASVRVPRAGLGGSRPALLRLHSGTVNQSNGCSSHVSNSTPQKSSEKPGWRGSGSNTESLRAASVHVPRPRTPHQVWRPLHITPTRWLPVEKGSLNKGSPDPQGSRLTATGPWKVPHWPEAAGS